MKLAGQGKFKQAGVTRSTILKVLSLLVLASAAMPFVLKFLDARQVASQSLPETLFSAQGAAQIERGRYLALAGNCASCHTVPGGGYMSGGLAFETPFGKIYSTNITMDAETGIGAWTGPQFFNSMRHGVRADGEYLYPVFPYTSFTEMTDEDLAALFAYFRTIPAISNDIPANDVSFPFNQRVLMSVWNALFFDAGEFTPDAQQSAAWNRGAYLVDALAHCGACHTPRNVLGGPDAGRAMGGGVYSDKVPGGKVRQWSAPNLTSAPNGLGLWTAADVTAYLKTGVNRHVATFGPMNEVIEHSTRYLAEADVAAMATYLKSLPPVADPAREAASSQVLGLGRTVYNLHCGTCHLPTGLGDKESGPRLASGSLVVQAENPASLINVILYGPEMPDESVPTAWLKPMEEYQYLLSDEEVAAVASFVRSNWDNPGGVVTAKQVAAQR